MTQLQSLVNMARSAQSDVKQARAALKRVELSADAAETLRADICENIYPILESLSRLGQRMATELEEIDGAVAELAEEHDEQSYVAPELQELISEAFAAGAGLHAELTRLLPTVTDDLSRKRIEEGLKTYARASGVAWQAVLETSEEVEGEDAEDEEEAQIEAEAEADDEHEDLTGPPTEENANG